MMCSSSLFQLPLFYQILFFLLISSCGFSLSLDPTPLQYPEDVFGGLGFGIFPPGQHPTPPGIQPPLNNQLNEQELALRMRNLAKDFARRYLSASDLGHLRARVSRARFNGASPEQVRRIVWHFLSEALSPEQKAELGRERVQLWAEFQK